VKVVVDTNVVLSGMFFGGLPGRVLDAWRDGHFTLVLSAPILAEYREAGAEFESQYGGSAFEAFAALLVVNSEIVDAPAHLPEQVCTDQDDDKFLACALAAGISVIVSGDKRLRAVSGWNGIGILTPRQFLDRYVTDSA
jgi:putative PIN family toxin of toxin-antitoxin system